MKKIFHCTLNILLLLFLSGCGEIEYTASVVPLELGTPDPNQQIPQSQLPSEDLITIEPIADLNSKQAIKICTEDLSWGDTDKGGCLQPGGSKYYFWNNPEEVIEVKIDTSDPNQLGFLFAADNRVGSKEDFQDDFTSFIVGIIGFGLEVPVAIAACTTIAGCALGAGALSLTGYHINETVDSMEENDKAFGKSNRQLDFYYCRIQGNSDQACRDALNISSSNVGEIND
jgi:hypothetical protein